MLWPVGDRVKIKWEINGKHGQYWTTITALSAILSTAEVISDMPLIACQVLPSQYFYGPTM